MADFQNFVLRFLDDPDVLASSVTDRTVFMSISPEAAPNVSGYLIKCKTLSLTVHVILNMVKLQNFVSRFLDDPDVLASSVTDRTVFMSISPEAAPNVSGN